MGSVLWAFANGYDDSPVKLEGTCAPVKSIGNSTTTFRDLICNEDVKIIIFMLAESVSSRLRKHGFRCQTVEISVRNSDLYSFSRQAKLHTASNITVEIAKAAYELFVANYSWDKPIRSIGVRGSDLVNDNYWEQIDLFTDVRLREKYKRADLVVDDIRRRFGYFAIQRGLMYTGEQLSHLDCETQHTVHPHTFFG